MHPPLSPEEQARRDADWIRGAWVCGLWLVGGAVVVSVASALEDGLTFSHGGLRGLASRAIALELARSEAPGLVGNAAWLGACTAARNGRTFSPFAFLAVPVLYPVPLLLGLGFSSGIRIFGFGAPALEFWRATADTLRASDFGVGLARTSAFALALMGLGFVLPQLNLRRHSLSIRVFIAWLLGVAAMGLVNFILDLILDLSSSAS